MTDPSLELQGAIVARLKGDAGVAALIANRVFDHVPRDTATGKVTAAFPYVSFGPEDTDKRDYGCFRETEISMQLDAWSRAIGFPEVKRVAGAVEAALEGAEINLQQNALALLTVTGRRVLRDPDGVTAHAVILITAVVQHG